MENGFEDTSPELPLANALDSSIIMHRDAHFGGSFDLMLDYYARGGKGVSPEIEVERIKELNLIEKEMKQNLAAVILSGPDAERVADAREAYKSLREVYNLNKPYNKHPKLLADLILSEKEDPEEEIEAIVKEKGAIVHALIDLIKSEDFHDPLFPGYGLAPGLAIKCLGRIGDKFAIIPLFESLDSNDFFDEETALQSLKAIGEPAKKFLLTVLQGKPITADNEKAALALIRFNEDLEVVKTSISLLEDPKVRKNELFSTYLALACEGLKDKALIKKFMDLTRDIETPRGLRKEMEILAKTFSQLP